jgi:hypothetical protein
MPVLASLALTVFKVHSADRKVSAQRTGASLVALSARQLSGF